MCCQCVYFDHLIWQHCCRQVGPRRKNLSSGVGEQKRHRPAQLVSAFVIPFLESIISKLATSEISIFLLVSLAEETVLCLVFSETPKTGFLATRPSWFMLTPQISKYNMGLVARKLSSGCPTKRVSNQSPQLQRLARKLKFHLKQVYI